MHFDEDFTEVCSLRPIQQYSSIGSDNGSELAKRQAIIWTNDGQIADAYMCNSASMRKSDGLMQKWWMECMTMTLNSIPPTH